MAPTQAQLVVVVAAAADCRSALQSYLDGTNYFFDHCGSCNCPCAAAALARLFSDAPCFARARAARIQARPAAAAATVERRTMLRSCGCPGELSQLPVALDLARPIDAVRARSCPCFAILREDIQRCEICVGVLSSELL